MLISFYNIIHLTKLDIFPLEEYFENSQNQQTKRARLLLKEQAKPTDEINA